MQTSTTLVETFPASDPLSMTQLRTGRTCRREDQGRSAAPEDFSAYRAKRDGRPWTSGLSCSAACSVSWNGPPLLPA